MSLKSTPVQKDSCALETLYMQRLRQPPGGVITIIHDNIREYSSMFLDTRALLMYYLLQQLRHSTEQDMAAPFVQK